MRKLKGDNAQYKQRLKNLPLGTCDLCGGVGRYKTTYPNKPEMISSCWQCSGTGSLKIRVNYTGEHRPDLFTDCVYDLINETDDHFVIINRNNELMQVPKDDFTKTTARN